jgi:RNA polymerase sigma factor (sigma-70 family)
MTAEDDDELASPPSDSELIAAVRSGGRAAFGTLYTRHAGAARRLAHALTRHPSDTDDLVAEAFARLLSSLRAGGGPDAAFRAYLLTTVRNLYADRVHRERRLRFTDDLSRHDAGEPFVDTAVERLERNLVARAFVRLPARWQIVLWHTEVEGEKPAAVARILDLTPNGVATLAYRARERLRQNYLREHVIVPPDGECRPAIERLGAYVRGGLSTRDRSVVDGHLARCGRCRVLYVELGDVNAGLRVVMAPFALGAGSGFPPGRCRGRPPLARARGTAAPPVPH